jgi:succinoglycan biosynthesis protein ExoL
MARVVFFAFDIAEAAQLRRIGSIRALGHRVASVSFRRDNMRAGVGPDWPNLDLGPSSNNRYLLRLLRLGRAALRLWRGRDILGMSDVWIARNLDMVLLAVLMRRVSGQRQVRLVYECLDIHGLFTRADAVGAAMRWVERRMLARCDLLILSSPGFLDAYFRPVQGIKTPVAMLENKLWVGENPLPRPAHPRKADADAPFVLGWVGSLRCARSLEILAETARALGPSVDIVCHGAVHHHALPGFDDLLAAHPNIRHAGAYRYPDDLSDIYTGCDAVWAQDLWQAGGNSDWLLPNRIYEASYFGCPSIAVAGTQTGRRIAEDGLGFTVPEAEGWALVELIRGLDRRAVRDASERLLARPASDFRLSPGELAAALAPVLAPADPSAVATTDIGSDDADAESLRPTG